VPAETQAPTGRIRVIKVGGNELDQSTFLDRLCAAIRDMTPPLVLVHGGGKEIAQALQRYGLEFEFVAGMRATGDAAMPVVEQVLSGAVNKRIVARLNQAGVDAIGISGVDLGLMKTRPLRPGAPWAGRDLGRVGEVIEVRTAVLHALLAQGWLPVVSPVSVDASDRRPTNVNADTAALAVAAALDADELMFVSNVPGVLIDGAVVPEMDNAAVEEAIAGGTITGGMVPKVRAATAALASVRAVRITDLEGLHQGGTRIVAGESA
jgi:acetylglutamate kinase